MYLWVHTHRADLLHYLCYSYGDPRDLHSFPTRRSSDLSSPCPARRTGGARRDSPAPDIPARAGISGAGLSRRADRKSTRLNSSHVRTSYAVFRLKKKSETGRSSVGPLAANREGRIIRPA